MKLKSKTSPAPESAVDRDLDEHPKRKPRAPKKGEVSHYRLKISHSSGEGVDNVSCIIDSKQVELDLITNVLKINGATVTFPDDSRMAFEEVTPVFLATKPQKGDKLMYQGNCVEYVGPHATGKKAHLVKLPNGMTFKAALSELTQA